MHGFYLGATLIFSTIFFFYFSWNFPGFFFSCIKMMNQITESKRLIKNPHDKTYFISSSNFEITSGEIR